MRLIIKMLFESLSQITNYFNKSNSIRYRGPQERLLSEESFSRPYSLTYIFSSQKISRI